MVDKAVILRKLAELEEYLVLRFAIKVTYISKSSVSTMLTQH